MSLCIKGYDAREQIAQVAQRGAAPAKADQNRAETLRVCRSGQIET